MTMMLRSIVKQTSIFDVIFTILVLTMRSSDAKKEIHLDSTNGIYDLFAEAIPYDRQALQVNITWKSNTKDSKFDVIVKPILTENCLHRDSGQRSCFAFGLPAITRHVILPVDPHPMVEHRDECVIQNECSYYITVQTINQEHETNLTYTVPDCVDGICSCGHRDQLPIAHLTAYFEEPSKINVIWNITEDTELPDGIRIESVYISIGVQDNPSLTWGGRHNKIFEIHDVIQLTNGTIITNGIKEIILNKTILIPGKTYSIKSVVIDNNYCHGNYGEFILKIPGTEAKIGPMMSDEFNYYKWILGIVIPIVIAVILLGIILQRYIKKIRYSNTMENWRGVYHNVPSGGGVQHVTMQDNFLYVDKDILEARDRGEADLLEVPHSCLTIGREIGKGAFGRVFIARAENIANRPGSYVVAVKRLKKRPTPDELEEFLSEISTMKTVSRHPNVVSLLGCCTIKQPLLMIMEYVGCGDLLQYLRKIRAKHEARSVVCGVVNNNQPIPTMDNLPNGGNPTSIFGPFGKYLELLHSSSSGTNSNSDASYVTQPDTIPSMVRPSVTETMYTMLSQNQDLGSITSNSIEYVLDHNELHNFAIQIAKGMRHLEERQITHRDLAARNVLIDENKTLKISDFGLSRSGIYVNTKNKKVPLRWLSLEAIRDNLYSSKSDVWAFGIVLWEIGTLGGFPYPTVGNHELLAYLTSGQRLQRPENCSELLYELMLQCWIERPEDRPKFSDIVAKLEPTNQKIYVDFSELGPDYVFPPTMEQIRNNITRPPIIK